LIINRFLNSSLRLASFILVDWGGTKRFEFYWLWNWGVLLFTCNFSSSRSTGGMTLIEIFCCLDLNLSNWWSSNVPTCTWRTGLEGGERSKLLFISYSSYIILLAPNCLKFKREGISAPGLVKDLWFKNASCSSSLSTSSFIRLIDNCAWPFLSIIEELGDFNSVLNLNFFMLFSDSMSSDYIGTSANASNYSWAFYIASLGIDAGLSQRLWMSSPISNSFGLSSIFGLCFFFEPTPTKLSIS